MVKKNDDILTEREQWIVDKLKEGEPVYIENQKLLIRFTKDFMPENIKKGKYGFKYIDGKEKIKKEFQKCLRLLSKKKIIDKKAMGVHGAKADFILGRNWIWAWHLKNNKTMNTTEIKKQIFSRYWNQEIAIQGDDGGTGFKYSITENTIGDIRCDYLLLCSVESITDEDAIEVCSLIYPKDDDYSTPEIMIKEGKRIVVWINDRTFSTVVYQYLQLKGYALPQLVILDGKPVTISVTQQIELGIIKIK